MVDIAPRPISGVNMPVDFASYLLSASPPGFDSTHQYTSLKPSSSEPVVRSSSDSLYAQIFAAVTTTTTTTATVPKTTSFTLKRQGSCSNKKKHVSFADELGIALTQVRIMSEPSHSPPLLVSNSAMLSLSGQRQVDSSSDTPNSTSCSSALGCPDRQGDLLLDFVQPVSLYERFQSRLSEQKVSVENVVARTTHVAGTIMVANVGFEKQVYVRFTRNSWISNDEVKAVYTAPESPSAKNNSRFDRFSFELHLGDDIDKAEFCVRYEVCGEQYWDSNGGFNYTVMSPRCKGQTSPPRTEHAHQTTHSFVQAPLSISRSNSADAETIFALDFQDNWSDFGWWQHYQDAQNPYY